MRPKLYAVAAFILMAVLSSCAGNDNNDYVDKSIIPAASEKAAAQQTSTPNQTAIPANSLPGTNVPGTGMPVNITQQPQSLNISPQTITQNAVPTVTAPGMNPPHGQPNHRCDIAEGAPLNSKPVPAATTKPTTVSTIPVQPAVTMKEVPNTQKTAPGMNPPHGEPGHRCDIAVGAALNSKPAPATAQPTTVSTQPAQPAVTMTEVPNKQKTAPGMNPPHGEPNHRCDIAVGAPLNSKPAPAPAPVQTKIPPPLIAPVKSEGSKN